MRAGGVYVQLVYSLVCRLSHFCCACLNVAESVAQTVSAVCLSSI